MGIRYYKVMGVVLLAPFIKDGFTEVYLCFSAGMSQRKAYRLCPFKLSFDLGYKRPDCTLRYGNFRPVTGQLFN